ncbi:MAG: gamma-glutamyltransferase [Ferrimonas sp.]
MATVMHWMRLLLALSGWLISGCEPQSVADDILTVPTKIAAAVPPTVASEGNANEPEADSGFQLQPVAQGARFMAATANPLATDAAYRILAKGGSAVDAAITAQLVLTLTEPQSSGLGGGFFMLYWDAKQQQLVSLDARETAPQAVDNALFMVNGQPQSWLSAVVGGRSVGVPATVKGLEQAHQRYGVLPWSSLFTAAIELAEQGFNVSPRLAHLLAMEINPGLQRAGAAQDYFAPAGQWLQAGQLRTNTALAISLQRIAEQGSAGFYQGELAAQIVAAVQQDADQAGALSLADLAAYQAIWRTPLCQPYREYAICGMAPPSSGGLAVAQILGLLEPYSVASMAVNSTEFIHLYVQAARIAFADRNHYVGDPDFVSVPTQQLLSDAYLQQRQQQIPAYFDRGRAAAGQFAPSHGVDNTAELPSTTQISIADAQGNVLSMTASIEMGFGSSIMVGGFLLNNQLTDFSFNPETKHGLAANSVLPNKRPRSSMAPTMVLNAQHEPILALGSPGGSRIINYVSHMLLALLDWQLPLAEAVALPRVSHRNDALVLEAGQGFEAQLAPLKARGYQVTLAPLTSGVQVIQRTAEGWVGAADPRREGTAKGG